MAGSATRRKAPFLELDQCTSLNPNEIFNLVPDDTLISVAHTCHLDLGETEDSYSHILATLKGPETRGGERGRAGDQS